MGTDNAMTELDMDPYNEDEAELRYLLSKPTCFIILGKPGSGKSTLARQLAQQWKCDIINATDVIQGAIEMQTELGVKAQEILLMGEALSESMVSKMIEEKINSPEVAHYGYVLDGLPSLSEDYMNIRDQLDLIKNWRMQPDFIINLKIPDTDLEVRRTGMRVDPMTGEVFTKEVYDPEKPAAKGSDKNQDEEEAEEEEEEEEEMPEEEEIAVGLPADVVERLVRRPEDLAKPVEEQIQEFKSNMLRELEDYMADHDQQYLIELDANKPTPVLFKELLMRLNCFVLRPAAVPIKLLDGEAEEELPEDIDTDEMMRGLAGKKKVAPRYRWRRSRWLRNCPVSLTEGNLVPGKPEFAVSFLDKIYTMANGEAMEKFLKNPRQYLLPPQPRSACKVCVTGPPCSGKTTLAAMLAEKYGAQVLDMNELIKPALEEERQNRIAAARSNALPDAIHAVKMKIQEQQAEQQALAAAANAETSESEHTAREAEEDAAEDGKADETKTEDTKPGETETEDVKTAESVTEDTVTAETRTEGEETRTDEQKTEADSTVLATTDGSITEPVEAEPVEPAEPTEVSSVTTRSDQPVEVTEDHPEVKAILDAAAKQVENEPIELRPEIWLEVMEKAVQRFEIENRLNNPNGPDNGNWILDDFPRTRDQWSLMIERGVILPDSVISLHDDSPSGEFLLKRWYKVNKEEVDAKVQARRDAEEAERLRREEEERLAQEAARLAEEEEARRLAEQERLRKIEEEAEKAEGESLEPTEQEPIVASEPGTEVAEPPPEQETAAEETAEQGETQEGDQKEDDQKDVDQPEADLVGDKQEPTSEPTELTEGSVTSETTAAPQQHDVAPAPEVDQDPLPPEGLETEEVKSQRKLFDNEWPNAASLLSGSTTIDPVSVDIIEKAEDGTVKPRPLELILEEACAAMEKSLQYQAWEVTAVDLDEETEDNDAEQELLAAEAAVEEEEEGEEEAAEEEEEDPNRGIKKHLGDTNYFCPVMLKEKNVLWPGDPEKAVKYREKTYYMSSVEAREQFIATPTKYLPTDKPLQAPPVRLLLLGPTGSGKTLHGRDLAKKLGVFHIQFHERLQELILAKTRRKVGPEFNEEHEEDMKVEEEDLSELEAEVAAAVAAITDPEGKPVPVETDKEKKTEEKSAEKKENEEEEEVKYTEDEEAIKNYLENDEALPGELLDKIVDDWWNKEPFKSTGFVLEGFPRTADEAEHMVAQGLFPDAAILLAVEDTDVIGRLLPPRMDAWHARRAKVLAKKERRKDLKRQKVEAEKSKKRAELLKEQEERRAERRAAKEAEAKDNGSEEGEEEMEEEEEEEEEEEDIEAILAEEFDMEEEEEDDELEHEDDAVDRIKNRLAEIYDNDINRLAAIQEKFEDSLIPRMEVPGGNKPHIVRYLINKKLRKIVVFRHSLFERVYPISERLAREMLQIGYKQPSRFGRWCPVQLMEGDCMQPMQGHIYPTFPAVYRQHIYFLSSASAREQFQQEPMTFLKQPSPKPVVPMRMAIIGPPKAGKTLLAKRFANEYGMVRLSVGEALRQLMEFQPKSDLSHRIKMQLYKGHTVPEELAVQALAVALLDMQCQTRGYILDGCPTTLKQAQLMREHNIIPVRMIELQLDSKEIVTRATVDRYAPERTQPVHDSHEVLATKLARYKQEIGSIRELYQQEHDNWTLVNSQRSKWWVWNECTDIGKETVVTIQTYLQRIAEGKAAGISGMCITPKQFEQRLSDYGQYCPVNLATKGQLVDCSVTKSLKYAAEFQGHYYKLEGEKELQMFLSEPEKYVPPLAPRVLPPAEMLPRRLTGQQAKDLFPKTVELLGYCSVTFLDGKCRYEAIVPGDPELVVEYRGKLYYSESEEKLQKFMRLPEKYWQLKLPSKLPPKKEPVQVTTLPMLGYMEQTVAQAITKALTTVGNFKPKYPFLTSSRSALVYVAFHLKAHNPRSSEYIRKKYRKKLSQFEDTCKLIQYLGDNMTRRYKEPVERPEEFDFKLEKFIHLKETKPMMSWIA